MKRILTILLCGLILTGCTRTPPAPGTVPPSAAATQPQEETASPAASATQPATPAETEGSLEALTVYYGDDNAEFILSKTVQVPVIDETAIVAALTDAAVLKEGVAVNRLTTEGSRLIIDFNRAFGDQLSSTGTAGEYIILGSTVNTFLTAYNGTELVFTVEGEVLETGHMVYDSALGFFS